ncbi:MAG TPA: GSCFA domain-containing protein [Chitinophagaceae bacterium]|nr:GSCFA domain-containing protein [Chitinophagaceae bacterium]
MKFQVDIQVPEPETKIAHHHKLALYGSCFTEHMGRFLSRNKFGNLENSHGIMFNPLSICKSLNDCVQQKTYTPNDLFYLNECWNSWHHHSDFSDPDPQEALHRINSSIRAHHLFLKKADWILITLGSAFAYYHEEEQFIVGNNHRAPANQFRKELLTVDDMLDALLKTKQQLIQFNPNLKIIFTISPVRHIRDGVIENNRSKARLIELVHAFPGSYYFPAYELVVDVLRDYRFYDVDLVHPNYQATAYVWEVFTQHYIDPVAFPVMEKAEQIYKARHHQARNGGSQAHARFMKEHLSLCMELKMAYPYIDLDEEIQYFQL